MVLSRLEFCQLLRLEASNSGSEPRIALSLFGASFFMEPSENFGLALWKAWRGARLRLFVLEERSAAAETSRNFGGLEFWIGANFGRELRAMKTFDDFKAVGSRAGRT